MKKLFTLLTVACMTFAVVGCGDKDKKDGAKKPETEKKDETK